MVFGMMLAGGLIAGGVMTHYATKDHYKSMAREQEQEEQDNDNDNEGSNDETSDSSNGLDDSGGDDNS